MRNFGKCTSGAFIALAMFVIVSNVQADTVGSWQFADPSSFSDTDAVFGFTVGSGKVGSTFFGLIPVYGTTVSNPWPGDLDAVGGSSWNVELSGAGLLKDVYGFSMAWDPGNGGVDSLAHFIENQLKIGGQKLSAGIWDHLFQGIWEAVSGQNIAYFSFTDYDALLSDNDSLILDFPSFYYWGDTKFTFTFYGEMADTDGKSGGTTPEPATLLILGLGAVGAGFVARRRMHK